MEQNKATGKLIRRNLIGMFGGSFLYALMYGFMFMVDAILAGQMVGAEGLSAVAIGLPGFGMLLATQSAVVHGTSLRLTWARGRGDQHEYERTFSGGLTFTGLYGLFLTLITLAFSKPMALIFGGANSTETVLAYTVMYIRYCAPMAFTTAISGALRSNLGVIGYQNDRAFLGIFNMVANVFLSILAVRFLPQTMKMAGLGIGSTLANLVEFFVAILFLRIRKVKASLKPLLLTPGEMGQIIKSGLPSSMDSIIDCAVAGIANNLILTGIPDEPMFLSVVSVVNNVRKIIRSSCTGMSYASGPLFGIFYAQRDKESLKRSLFEALRLGVVFTLFWCCFCYAILPVLTRLYGTGLTEEIRTGIILVMVFMPFFLGVTVFTAFYEATERFVDSLLMASIPDSLVYPLMLFLLIPLFGKNGIWVALAANSLFGLMILLPLMALKSRNNPNWIERILRFKPQLTERSPEFSFEMKNEGENVTGISESVQNFLMERGYNARTAYLSALCIEELAVDMAENLKAHPKRAKSYENLLDLKLFDDGDTLEIVLRSMGRAYDPLDYEVKTDNLKKIGVTMVRRMAKKISYTYAYSLNMLMMQIEK